MSRFYAGGFEVSVDLRRGQVCMAQQFLNRAQIRAALQKMGSEAVAEKMRV